MVSVQDRYESLKKQCGEAKLIAVSKMRSVDEIDDLLELGQRDFGENRLQEWQQKASHFSGKGIRWHFIGHLQTNKVKALLEHPEKVTIHSVDRIKVLNKIEQVAKDLNLVVSLFLQCNPGGEKEKGGFDDEAELLDALVLCRTSPHIHLQGLMAMAPLRVENQAQGAEEAFARMKKLRAKADPHLKLSMGMSEDFTIALKYGADFVRIGSALFQGP